jgi:aryl-alcohol dehydrogenase-like predicted oxidoreductase
MYAWQFQKALYVSEKNGWARFVSMQSHLNLIYREEEREMLPLCLDQRIGVIPYSPLASGRLVRDESGEATLRTQTDNIQRLKYVLSVEINKPIIERMAELANQREVKKAHIALAWVLQKTAVTAPIIGATKLSHLEDAVGSVEVNLTSDEIAFLEEPYLPHAVVGALPYPTIKISE